MSSYNKYEAFILKILEKTKSGEFKWVRGPARSGASFYLAQKGYSFTLRKDFGECVLLAITYDSSVDPIELDSDEEDALAPSMIRLYDYVYNLFPNFDRFVDDFIKGD